MSASNTPCSNASSNRFDFAHFRSIFGTFGACAASRFFSKKCVLASNRPVFSRFNWGRERNKQTRKTRRVRTLDAREGNTTKTRVLPNRASTLLTPRRIDRVAHQRGVSRRLHFKVAHHHHHHHHHHRLRGFQNSKSNVVAKEKKRSVVSTSSFSRTSLIAHRVQRHAQLRLDQRSTRPVREQRGADGGVGLLLRGGCHHAWHRRRRRRRYLLFYIFGEKEGVKKTPFFACQMRECRERRCVFVSLSLRSSSSMMRTERAEKNNVVVVVVLFDAPPPPSRLSLSISLSLIPPSFSPFIWNWKFETL